MGESTWYIGCSLTEWKYREIDVDLTFLPYNIFNDRAPPVTIPNVDQKVIRAQPPSIDSDLEESTEAPPPVQVPAPTLDPGQVEQKVEVDPRHGGDPNNSSSGPSRNHAAGFGT